jgi:putative zinc finger protein
VTDRRVPRCTRVYDPRLREAVGAYLLGALEPAEADEVAAHLSECESCRADYAELADLVPLMAMVTEQDAVRGPLRPEPAVLGRVLETSRREGAQVQAKRGQKPPISTAASFAVADAAPAPAGAAVARRRPGRTRLALTAACVLLAAAGSVVGVRMSTHAAPSNSWSATVMVSSYGNSSGASGNSDIMVVADVTPTSWGSKITLQMQNVPDGYKCSMVVWGTDGRREPDGSWTAPAGQTTFTIPATSSFSPDHISAIDVNLPGGVNLLRVSHP